MDVQDLLKLARWFRLGKFPRQIDKIPWVFLPGIPHHLQSQAIERSGMIADMDSLPLPLDSNAALNALYPGFSQGPANTVKATVDLTMSISRQGDETIYRNLRIETGWHESLSGLKERIDEAIAAWSQKYAFRSAEFGFATIWVY